MEKLTKLLKPKSEEEINEIEKRGFLRNKGKWKFSISIKEAIERFEKDNDKNKLVKGIIKSIEDKKNDIRLIVNTSEFDDLVTILGAFKTLPNNPSDDSINSKINELYDWADFNCVWVESV